MNGVLNMRVNLKVYLALLATIVVLAMGAKFIGGLQDSYVIILTVVAAVTAVPVYRKFAGFHDDEKDSE